MSAQQARRSDWADSRTTARRHLADSIVAVVGHEHVAARIDGYAKVSVEGGVGPRPIGKKTLGTSGVQTLIPLCTHHQPHHDHDHDHHHHHHHHLHRHSTKSQQTRKFVTDKGRVTQQEETKESTRDGTEEKEGKEICDGAASKKMLDRIISTNTTRPEKEKDMTER